MRTVNISLPDPMRDFIESRVTDGLYGSISDYIRALIREDQRRKTQEELEHKLVAALDSGDYRPVTPDFFEQLHARIANRNPCS